MSDYLQEMLISISYVLDEASKSKMASLLAKGLADVEAEEEKSGRSRLSLREKLAAALLNAEKAAGAERMAAVADLGQQEREAKAKAGKAITDDHKKESKERERIDKDHAKETAKRRSEETKELRKFATEVRDVMGTVTAALGGAIGATSIGGFLSALRSSAGDYSRLSTQSKRTGSSPQNIKALEFAMEQMGVDRGEADSSLEAFSKMYQDNPAGYASLLAGMRGPNSPNGIQAKDAQGNDRDLGSVLEEMGKWFGSVSTPVARAQAGRFGIGPDAMNALRQYAELAKHVEEFNKKAGTFGLDINKVTEDGKKFTAAYNEMATDLGMVWTKVENEFYGPLTRAMKEVSAWLEAHPNDAKLYVEGFLAFSAALTATVIPTLLRLTGALTGLSAIAPPAWLLRYLGVPGVVAAVMAPTAANAGEPQIGPDGTITYPDGHTEKAKQWDGKSGAGGGSAKLGDHVRHAVRAAVDGVKQRLGIGGGNKGERGWWTPERQSHAVDYLMSRGVSEAGAKALVSRWKNVESPGGPTAVNPISGAAGIGQWLGPRQQGGYNGTFDEQLKHAADELDGQDSQGKRAKELLNTPGMEATGASVFERAEGYNIATGRDNFTDRTAAGMGDIAHGNFPPPAAPAAAPPASAGASALDDVNHMPGAPQLKDFVGKDGVLSDEAQQRYDDARAAFWEKQHAQPTRQAVPDEPKRFPTMSITSPAPSGTSPFEDAVRDFYQNNTLAQMQAGAMKMAPQGFTPSTISPMSSIDNSRGNTNHSFVQNVQVHGIQKPDEVVSQIKLASRRGGRDFIRNTQGSVA